MIKILKDLYWWKNTNAWYIILVLPVLFLYSPFTIDPVLHIKFIAFVLLLILGVTILIKQAKDQIKIPLLGLVFSIGWFVYWIISCIGLLLSDNKSGDGIFLWLQIFLNGLMPVLIISIFQKSKDFNDNVFKLFTITGIVALLASSNQFFECIVSLHFSHALLYKITSAFAHKNIFSEILLLILPLSIIAFIKLNKIWRYLGLIASFCALFMIVFLMSKAVWLAFVVASAFFLLCFLIFQILNPIKGTHFPLKKLIIPALIFLTFILIGIVLISRSNINKPLRDQTKDLTLLKANANNDRFELWGKTFLISKSHVYTGIGLGNWKIDILKAGNKNLVSQNNNTFFQRPHNDYLWIYSEQGLPALLVYLFLMCLILAMGCRLAFNTNNLRDRIVYLLLIFGITAYLVYSGFSFPKERVEHSVLLGFIYSMIIINYAATFDHRSIKINKVILIPVFLILGFSLFVGISRYKSEIHIRKAYEARATENWEKEEYEISKAYTVFCKMDLLSTPLMWYAGEASFNLKKIDKALANFKEAEKISPYHIHVLNNVATCYEIKGNHNAAIRYYNSAIHYSVYFEDALLNLAAVYFNKKDYETAISILHKVKPDTKDSRYQKFAYAIINKYLTKVVATTDNNVINKYLKNIQFNPNWAFDIFKKSYREKHDFKKQLMLDIIWSIEMIDKDYNTARVLKEKNII
jgi:O-antigen ligase